MRWLAGLFLCVCLAAFSPLPTAALPVFAHRYGLTCQACHSTVPRLNTFGEAFRASGFALPNARGVFPAAIKVQLAYSSDPDPTGLPKGIVDEVELLSGGTAGKNTNFFIEQYVVDGGRPGLPREAWLQFTSAKAHLKIGQFELPLPVELESERETLAHYALYDQSVGANTFTFFDPRIGVDASFGNDDGLRAHFLALHAYDPQTTTPRSGIDLMGSVAKSFGPLEVQTYRYSGRRNFAVQDNFWRQGYVATLEREKFWLTGALQTGNDSSADAAGAAARSSGGFFQTGYRFTDAFAMVARYEGTADELSGLQRRFVLGAIARPRRNMRFTIEGVRAQSHTATNLGLLFAY
ncbi:MAG: hypothetical protein ABR584_07935 [Candidatus Baltobacteraceae bacterium]